VNRREDVAVSRSQENTLMAGRLQQTELTAMTSIEGAMRNMMAGTEHVDRSAQRLAAVGSELRQMVQRYKV